jgi:endonuclease-3
MGSMRSRPSRWTTESPFTLLVAVLLSAQTTDKKVNQVTPALFAGGSPARGDGRAARRQTIREHHPRGGARAHQGPQASAGRRRAAGERHGGVVPATWTALEALPGVGHKTASVVMAQAFGVPSFPVDTHIHRLAERWGLSAGENVETTERDLKALFARETWNRRHLQIIFFGREHCPARGHDWRLPHLQLRGDQGSGRGGGS